MRAADLQPGEAVERPFENQMRQRDRGLQRVADHIRQPAAALQPAARLQFGGALRVNEDQHAEFFGLRSEEHTSELQSLTNLVCRLLLEKKKKRANIWDDSIKLK